jgi:hypothetical protein
MLCKPWAICLLHVRRETEISQLHKVFCVHVMTGFTDDVRGY